MNRSDVIARLKAAEPALRTRGVGALYLFGSYARDEAQPGSDVDVFVEPAGTKLYGLSNYVGAYDIIRQAVPASRVGYSTRDGLSSYVRDAVEREAVRIF